MYLYSYYDLATGRFTGRGSNSDKSNVAPKNGRGVIEGHYNHTTQMVVDGVVENIPVKILHQESLEYAWLKLRSIRDSLLASCDWTQVPDAPVDQAAWATYRQALRDLPENTIDPENPNWPIPPS